MRRPVSRIARPWPCITLMVDRGGTKTGPQKSRNPELFVRRCCRNMGTQSISARAVWWAAVLCLPALLSAYVPVPLHIRPARPGGQGFLCAGSGALRPTPLPASRRDSTTWPALRAVAADGDGADNDSFDIRKMCVSPTRSRARASVPVSARPRRWRAAPLSCSLALRPRRSMEEIEALPELGQCTGGDEGRPPMVEELMAEDVRFGMKMRALRGDFAP